jgi:hypothetical protein
MSSQAPAGWYPDPSGAPGQRWWDGGAWSTNVAPAPPQPVGSAAVPVGAVGSASMPVAGGQPTASPYMYPTGTPQGYPGGAGGRSRHHYSLYTLAVVAIYVVVAVATHIVFLGIFPLILAYRSTRDHEPLAPLAIGAALLSCVVAGVLIFGH